MKTSTRVAGLALATTLIMPMAVQAESSVQTGAGPLTANAHVDFSIVIPKFLFLRVGSSGAGIDLITFTVPAASVGIGGAGIAGTGGDLGAGQVTAVVQANSNGTVTLTANATGALSDGAGDTINYTQITTSSNNPSLPPPVLANGASGPISLLPVGKLVNQSAVWTYNYSNSAVVPAGTYGGVNTNNSRVTYTAALP